METSEVLTLFLVLFAFGTFLIGVLSYIDHTKK